jgi:eukaryotic-like serine/threonine-protein kinase
MTTNTASHDEAGGTSGAPVRAGDVVADKYLIERTLGVGGMGVVVAARDQVLDREVAIKFLLPKLASSETAVQRFVREARAATRITSEHVVRLLEIEKLPSGTPFFVMEYLEGCDLRTLLRERGPLASSQAVDYALQALQAVAEGHVKGVVHRDIKPGNLFLTHRADGTALIKVLDFGIAKTVESDTAEATALTSSDDVRLGSPAYMPPEQLQNPRDVDTRSDIWSLGATLYELLSGRPPFEGNGYLDLASRVLSQPPTPLSRHRAPDTLPSGLQAVIERCLEKDRNQRYSNAAELATALAPYGTADSRMSLTRVSGMLASSSSFPALVRSVAADVTDCAPTLDVNGVASAPPSIEAPPPSGRDRRTSDHSSVSSSPPPQPGRSWVVIGAAAVIVLGLVALRNPFSSSDPRSAGPAAPAPAAAALVTPPGTVPALQLTPIPQLKSAASGEQTKSATKAPPPKPSAKPVVSMLAAATAPPPVETQRAALQVKLPPELAVSTLVPPSPAPSGRSDEIERLIERRR